MIDEQPTQPANRAIIGSVKTRVLRQVRIGVESLAVVGDEDDDAILVQGKRQANAIRPHGPTMVKAVGNQPLYNQCERRARF